MPVRSTNHEAVMNAAALFLAAAIEDKGLTILASDSTRVQVVTAAMALSEEVDKQIREAP